MKKHIPNILTLGNLFCGCLALVNSFDDSQVVAAYFVGIALVLDFFDGFVARLLKVSSPIGKDLDSLADMVTFGVVPGAVMFHLISYSGGKDSYNPMLPYFAFIITIFSCIRLAKFNNDKRQTDSFIGLPTPANGMVICALPLIFEFNHAMYPMMLQNPYALCLFSLVMSLLLISEIPLFALKFKNFGWADNKLRFVFIALSVVLFITLEFVAIPLVIIMYILLSIVNNIFLKKKV